MSSISDLKAAFYDSQRQASNLFEALVGEVLALNEKLKPEEEKKESQPPKKAK
jgi:hypothetical protein